MSSIVCWDYLQERKYIIPILFCPTIHVRFFIDVQGEIDYGIKNVFLRNIVIITRQLTGHVTSVINFILNNNSPFALFRTYQYIYPGLLSDNNSITIIHDVYIATSLIQHGNEDIKHQVPATMISVWLKEKGYYIRMEVLPVIEVGDYMEDIISVRFCGAFIIKELFSNMPTGQEKVINTFMMPIKHNAVRGKESQFSVYHSYLQLDL